MKKKNKKVNAAILVIGNEILSGRTQDKNVAFISDWLNSKCGITVQEVRIIPDIEKIIINNIQILSKNYNYVFTTGGIGPTHDDITFEGVAKAFDDTTFLHPEMEQLIRDYFKDVNDAVLKLGQVCYQMIILFFLFYCGLKQQ